MNWFVTAFKRYAKFNGRAGRSEYWYFTLISILVSVVLSVIDVIAGTFSTKSEIGLLSGLFALAIIIPGLAVTVRRLHDTDRSGWWVFIAFIPALGVIVLFVFMCFRSDSASNRFGTEADPQL